MNVHIKNKEELNKKIEKIKRDGINSLHVIADWDRTLTKEFFEGERTCTSFEHIRKSGFLSEEYTKKSYALFDHYYPIEQSDEISAKEKNEKMYEWWSKHLQLLIESGLKKEFILDMIKKEHTHIRDGFNEFFKLLEKHSIPILIFSAGLGDVIKEFLINKNQLYHNVHIISNFFRFDDNNKIIGFENEIIHSMNKKEVEIKQFLYYGEIKERKNVILLGDTLGDLEMAEEVDHDCIIKIGFLNKPDENKFEKFSNSFDVVVLNDGDLNYVNELIKLILSS